MVKPLYAAITTVSFKGLRSITLSTMLKCVFLKLGLEKEISFQSMFQPIPEVVDKVNIQALRNLVHLVDTILTMTTPQHNRRLCHSESNMFPSQVPRLKKLKVFKNDAVSLGVEFTWNCNLGCRAIPEETSQQHNPNSADLHSCHYRFWQGSFFRQILYTDPT